MFCIHCGSAVADGSEFCSVCGRPLGARPGAALAAAAGSTGVSLPGGGLPAAPYAPVYAGFWLRFIAMVIDSLVLTPLVVVLIVPFGLFLPAMGQSQNVGDLVPMFFSGAVLLMVLLIIGATWLYYTGMESSRHQATLGKKLLGLVVTDMNGRRISFGRANGRFFGKYLSGMVLNIGYIMAAFTERKQALHDLLANCLVVKR